MLWQGSTIPCHRSQLVYKGPLCQHSRGLKKEDESQLTVLVLGGEQDFTLPWQMQMRQGRKEMGSNMTGAGRKQRRLFYILIHMGFFWCCIESTRALTYYENQLSCIVCTIILPPGGEEGAEHFVFWRRFHLLFFKSMCCCETEAVRGGSLAAVGEQLPFSAMLPVRHAWAGSTLLTEILCTQCSERWRTLLPLRCTEWGFLVYLRHNFASIFIIPMCLVFF